MIVGSIPRRYAKALFELAAEQGKVEAWSERLAALRQIIESASELQDVLVNPIYTADQRRAILGKIATALSLDAAIANLISLLGDRNRLGYLAGIVDAFTALADQKLGRVRARVTSAVPLDPAAAGELSDRLARATRAQVIVDSKVDPQLIGGVVAQVGDLTYDGSIRAQLEALRTDLKQ
jgi:F-type H+-transporting ATPase subunit delta